MEVVDGTGIELCTCSVGPSSLQLNMVDTAKRPTGKFDSRPFAWTEVERRLE